MILITSGAYLSAEFSSLLGQMPPSFLPVGNRRLYEWQLEDLAGLNDQMVLTVPQGYLLDEPDSARLSEAGVQVLRIPPGMSLGQSVVYAVNVKEAARGPVRILHGDTLCGPVRALGDDLALTGVTEEFYSWAEYDEDAKGRPHFREGLPGGASPRRVLSGYFAVSDGAALVRCISEAGMDFIGGLDRYAAERHFRLRPAGRWLDFGHVQTYFKSKARHTTERAFNRIDATPRRIEKSSSDQAKIDAEAAWYEALPQDLRLSTPQYLGRAPLAGGSTSYGLEYLYSNTLAELAVFGRLPIYSWQRIFHLAGDLLTRTRSIDSPSCSDAGLASAYAQKTAGRLDTFARAACFDLDAPLTFAGRPLPSLARIRDDAALLVEDATPDDIGLLHGDFCFSNIFLDARSAQLKMIDPRGRDFSGTVTPWGDVRYDLAKLMHSVWGRYDFIVAGRFSLDRPDAVSFDLRFPETSTGWDQLQACFFDLEIAGYDPSSYSLRAMTIQLFLSMLPLHADSQPRQWAFLANALRLYLELE
jgi:hypothetical protein